MTPTNTAFFQVEHAKGLSGIQRHDGSAIFVKQAALPAVANAQKELDLPFSSDMFGTFYFQDPSKCPCYLLDFNSIFNSFIQVTP